MNKEQIKLVNKTARSKGTIGRNAILPKYIIENFEFDKVGNILDFGAGKNIIHTKALRDKGYLVDAYDIGDNFIKGVHTEIKDQKYDIIFASNVINILPNLVSIIEVIGLIYYLLDEDGCTLFNFPKNPRKLEISDDDFKELLYHFFNAVRIEKYNSTKIFICRREY